MPGCPLQLPQKLFISPFPTDLAPGLVRGTGAFSDSFGGVRPHKCQGGYGIEWNSYLPGAVIVK